jgi:tyrosine-specific transport protein
MWRWILATAFIASCSLGTGLIGQAFTVSLVGFWPSIAAIALAWGYLLFTALYELETVLALPIGANLYTFSKICLGPIWAWIISAVWLFIGYGFLITFFAIAPPLMAEIAARYAIALPTPIVSLGLFVLVGSILFAGIKSTMIVNFVLFGLLGVILYHTFQLGSSQVSTHALMTNQWPFLIIVLPSLVNGLYYQVLIPSIASFLNYKIPAIRSSIITGSLLAAACFVLWMVPVRAVLGQFESESLGKIRHEVLTNQALSHIPIIGSWMPLLSALSMLSAAFCLGVIGIDFFGDLFKYPIKRKGSQKLLLTTLVVIPPYLLSFFPIHYVFKPVLYLSDFSAISLAGLLPLLWVVSLRYFLKQQSMYHAPGGKITLIVATTFTFFIFYLIGIEIIYQHSL